MSQYKSNTLISHGNVTKMRVYMNTHIHKDKKNNSLILKDLTQSPQVTKLMKCKLLYNIEFSKSKARNNNRPRGPYKIISQDSYIYPFPSSNIAWMLEGVTQNLKCIYHLECFPGSKQKCWHHYQSLPWSTIYCGPSNVLLGNSSLRRIHSSIFL